MQSILPLPLHPPLGNILRTAPVKGTAFGHTQAEPCKPIIHIGTPRNPQLHTAFDTWDRLISRPECHMLPRRHTVERKCSSTHRVHNHKSRSQTQTRTPPLLSRTPLGHLCTTFGAGNRLISNFSCAKCYQVSTRRVYIRTAVGETTPHLRVTTQMMPHYPKQPPVFWQDPINHP